MVNQTPPWETHSDAALAELLGDDEGAMQFVRDIAFASHVYDDLIDRDVPVADERIHALMWKLMIAIPLNPFYRTHQNTLQPLLVTAMINWRAANQIEEAGVLEELRVSHTLRYAVADVVLMCIALVRGQDYAMHNARRARLMFQHDTWEHYSFEHYRKDHHAQ